MTDPHTRDRGLRRIATITGWITAAAVSAAAVISVGVARANDHASQATATTSVSQNDPTDPSAIAGGTGLQPPASAPTQGIGAGQAVSGGS